jgi:hypothetical protein
VVESTHASIFKPYVEFQQTGGERGWLHSTI